MKFFFLIKKKNILRVPVLLSDRSGSPWSVFCGFIDDGSNSFDDGSTNSSSFRLFVLLLICTGCLEENISENWFIGESDEDICCIDSLECNNMVGGGNVPLSISLFTKRLNYIHNNNDND